MRHAFEKEFLQLLAITAPSGYEKPVAEYLINRLTTSGLKATADAYFNVLGEAVYGSGEGPVVLLSAHMDTVPVHPGRSVIRNGSVWSSSSGPLGADDRAGIAIILSVLDQLQHTGFDGTIRLAFTREEEVGCVGSCEIDPAWLRKAELAIVVDRRGSRDIVVRNGYIDFCDDLTAARFERAAVLCGMPDWRAVTGGTSDAVTYASLGIPSVNLSTGYQLEHTARETVNIDDCLDTIRLIVGTLVSMSTEKQRNIHSLTTH
ncbi:M20/M25/M40 family metallo-hydrolase [Paenibacillus sediminis]|uniref:Aminopeptidase FrvX n=1 Tax=Paenibacillus sediminis TaxID=664909 RepID=A0ABS4GYI5_9BACL|nr:M20/M25/M40 family metallo-hydrolase [Paenibacillus sediminis]MBP1935325.1 putative aminopeptidase FrvX [Paenibacillus sediminis]